MMIQLPAADGTVVCHRLTGTPIRPRAPDAPFNRVAFAAAHVVPDLIDHTPWSGTPRLDWDATLRLRQDLWDQGLHLAEAMDTAQRGMGVDWATARELIERTMIDARAHSASPRVACGAGTDQLPPGPQDEAAIVAAWSEQMEAIDAAGGQIILMASRAMAALGAGPDDYLRVYDTLIEQASQPVILHWLGEAFDPALKGYWGSDDLDRASETVLQLIAGQAAKIDGIKVSLLDQNREEALRARLPEGVRLYTGDDFNYPALIRGDGAHHSHALLGIFAAIAPAAARGLAALARGDTDEFDRLMLPTVPLAREIFCPPTQHYKVGIALLAWLNGLQPGFVMVGGLQTARGITHHSRVFQLADAAGMLRDSELAVARMTRLLEVYGFEQAAA